MTKQQFNIQYFETILPNDIREELNYDLTVALKSIIDEKLESRTGFLMEITEVKVSVSKTIGTFRVKINTTNYWRYLDEKYGLTKSFINHRAYKNALKVFKELSDNKYDEIVGLGQEKSNPYI